jgi:hypothetical protein
MKLNDTARLLIGSTPATLVTVNRDGSPQVSVVWMVVQSTADGDDQLVTAPCRGLPWSFASPSPRVLSHTQKRVFDSVH